MNSRNARAIPCLTVAGSVLIFLAGCGTAEPALNRAFADRAGASLAEEAIAMAEAEREAARRGPQWPAACKRRVRSGVKLGDRLDHATLKTDFALGQANELLVWCGNWFEKNYGGPR